MAKRPAASSARANGRSATKKARVEAPAKASGKPAGILKKPPPAHNGGSNSKGKAGVTANGSAAVKGKGKAIATTTSFDESSIDNPAAAAAAAAAVATGSSGLAEISKYQLGSKKSVPTAFEVVAGSYERILYGLHCAVSHSGQDAGAVEVEMQPIFQFPAHLTCVKTACASPNGRWLVTGAADEVIKVWDLRRRKEVGGLLGHEGDITSLSFPSDKYLVSTSADGTLCLFRTKDWSVLRRFKGHKGKVIHAAVHPQGRVALTVGKDRCLRMWDLLGRSTGKSSTSTKLGAEADLVRWSVNGSKFAVVLDHVIRIYNLNMDRLHTVTSRSRYHDVQFAELDNGTEILLVASEDGKTRIYDHIASEVSEEEEGAEPEPRCSAELVGHANRVKAISVVRVLNQQIVASISSDGTIKTFSLASLEVPSEDSEPRQIEPLSSYDTKGSRLTCLTAIAVSDDRMTTAAASVRDEQSDSDDSQSEASDVEDELAEEAEDDEEEEAEVEGEDEEEEAEWGGIDEE